MTAKAFKLDHWLIDPTTNSILQLEKRVVVEPLIMDLLICLSSNIGEVVSRETIINEVWQGRSISDEAISRAIFLLRKAFKDLDDDRNVIKTVYKRGYMLDIAASPASRSKNKRIKLGIALAAAASIGLIIITLAFPKSETTDIRAKNINDLAPTAITIVVDDISNNTNEPAHDYITTAIHEGAMQHLGRNPNLMVIDSETLKAQTEQAPDFLLSHASARYHLSSSLSIFNAQKILSVALYDDAEKTLWSDAININDINNAIIPALETIDRKVSLAIGEDYIETQSCPIPLNPDSMELFYKARHALSLRGEGNLRQAIAHLKRALEIDNNFPAARSALAMAYFLLPGHIDDYKRAQKEKSIYRPLAKETAKLALKQCRYLAEAYLLAEERPDGKKFKNEWIEKTYIYHNASMLEPSNAHFLRLYADQLEKVGRSKDALRIAERAYLVNPLELRALFNLAFQYIANGDYASALKIDDQAKNLGPNSFDYIKVQIAIFTQEWATAKQLLNQQTNMPEVPLILSVIDTLQDDSLRQETLDKLYENHQKNKREMINFTVFFAAILGDVDLIYDVIENTPEDTFLYLPSLWHPVFTGFRQDKRFIPFADKLGWVDYWHHFGPADTCKVSGTSFVCS